jgi:hypothetical protein
LLFSESSVPNDVIEKLTSIGILHNHEEFFFGFDNLRYSWLVCIKSTYLIKLNDIRMTHLLQNFNFAGDTLNVFLIVDLLFLQDFDGDLFKEES